MKKLYAPIVNLFSKDRIELLFAIIIAWASLIYLLNYFLSQGDVKGAALLISPFIITIGVIVALDNLITSEKNRQKDKAREESRFRFDICLGQLEKLMDALKPQSIPLGEGNSWVTNSGWSYLQLNKAKILIDSYSELKEGVLDEHHHALNVEESIYKNAFITQASSHSGFDYFKLLYQGCSSADIEERLYRHNERLMELAEEPDGKNFRYWDTNEQQKLPNSISPDLLLKVIWFFLPDCCGQKFCEDIPVQRAVQILEETGLHGIADYFLWSMTVSRNHDGTLILTDELYTKLESMEQ